MFESNNAQNTKRRFTIILSAVPNGWFSWDFTIFDDHKAIAKIDLAWVREAGKLYLDGSNYRVFREGLLNGSFIIEKEGLVLARAEKPSALIRSYKIDYNNKSYTLEAESALRREFVLREDGQTIGSVRPENAFTKKAIIDLPAEIALPVRIFMVWLTLILWKREEAAA
ncbi:MAG: hypothetical protein C0399_03280 [Syntrophus sp. (in: bacteria)]|nr:hypothetical protein [Syntrophus sp. (in: bacteria)]